MYIMDAQVGLKTMALTLFLNLYFYFLPAAALCHDFSLVDSDSIKNSWIGLVMSQANVKLREGSLTALVSTQFIVIVHRPDSVVMSLLIVEESVREMGPRGHAVQHLHPRLGCNKRTGSQLLST